MMFIIGFCEDAKTQNDVPDDLQIGVYKVSKVQM